MRRAVWLLIAFVALLSGCARRVSPPPDGSVTVRFLNVGQGDATLIQWPGGAALVDAGPRGSAETLVRSLRRYGVSRLDLAVATHPDSDHVGGYPQILRSFPVGRFLDSGFVSGSPAQETMLKELHQRDVPFTRVSAGQTLEPFEGLRMHILGPPKPLIKGTKSDSNNNSVVILMEHGGVRLLLPGDVERAGQRAMLRGGNDPRADVLKLAHHGSANATDAHLLEHVRPRFAVISAGRGNPYGHPHREPLAALKRHGIAIYRTDLQGTITMRSDGRTVRFETERRANDTDLFTRGKDLTG